MLTPNYYSHNDVITGKTVVFFNKSFEKIYGHTLQFINIVSYGYVSYNGVIMTTSCNYDVITT